MVCRDCVFMKAIGKNGLYICDNPDSESYGEYTGPCCEDECEDGSEGWDDEEIY